MLHSEMCNNWGYAKLHNAIEQHAQVSVDLLTKILKMEEGHVDWAEQQRNQLAQMGLATYLANQSQGAAG